MPGGQIDTGDIPELNGTFFETARLVLPIETKKKTMTMRIDEDVLEWFGSHRKSHLTCMNAVLRAYMLAHHDQELRDKQH